MIEVLFYSYLSSVHIYICGNLFFHIIFKGELNKNYNLFELGFFGIILLSFIGLTSNFFLPLNKIFNSIVFIIPFLLVIFYRKKILFSKICLYSIPVSVLILFTIVYDGTYRPDAGSYHLPYISMLNESKILVGINNIHFRFGHTSIIQYLSAIHNNLIFNEKGIIIPIAFIFCNFIFYCIYELFVNKNETYLKILIFIITTFVVFRVSRFSDFGNDAPANLIFFYLIIESLKKEPIFIKSRKAILASSFIFLNKITLLLSFFIALYYLLVPFKLKNLFNRVIIFSSIFVFLYIGKNVLISGCLIFPIEQTCLKSIYWYDKNSNRNSNAINARQENEAWTKGWFNQKGEKKDYAIYIENYDWIDTWLSSEAKTIKKKLLPFSIFILSLYFFLILHTIKNKNITKSKIEISKDTFVCLIVCLMGSIVWFLKFPVFRYGYAYLISFFAIFLTIIIKDFMFFKNTEKVLNSMKYLMIFLLFGLMLKNFYRINNGIENNISLWPNIYSSENNFKKKSNKPIYKNGSLIFYKSKREECYYSSSPCTHFFNGKDFKIEDINLDSKLGYKIYYFKK